MKKDFLKLVVRPNNTIRDALECIEKGQLQISFVCDDQGAFLGTLSDGDIRRAMLKGMDVGEKLENVFNKNSPTVHPNSSRDQILNQMRQLSVRRLPVVNSEGKLVGVEIYEDRDIDGLENKVVILAGGEGSRLGEITRHTPKPLVAVGEKPILETIIGQFSFYGFKNFFLSVNYKSEMIIDYFKDGQSLGVDIQYLKEKEKLGTAGSLSLIDEKITEPVIVMNADLLTNLNFSELLNFHKKNGGAATMCVRRYETQVPYGVVSLNDLTIESITEKPVFKFFVSAGIYVLEPRVFGYLEREKYLDMPELFKILKEKKEKCVAFPIGEYWRDIGKPEDLHMANFDFGNIFGNA